MARRALSIAWLLLSIGTLLPIRIVLLRIWILLLTGLLVVLWRGRGILVGSLLQGRVLLWRRAAISSRWGHPSCRWPDWWWLGCLHSQQATLGKDAGLHQSLLLQGLPIPSPWQEVVMPCTGMQRQ